MGVLRDIFRRRIRSLLTIFGVSVGVFALVVLGAVAEKAHLSVQYIGDFYDNRVVVVDKKDVGVFGLGGGKVPIARESLEKLRDLEGVARVEDGVTLMLDESAVPMGMPAMIVGGAGLGPGGDASFQIKAARGRLLGAGERRTAVVGTDLVKQLGAEVGGTVKLRGEEFDVVGVLDRTFVQLIDQAAIVPIADAQELFVGTLPDAFRSRVATGEVVLQATVLAEDGVDADGLARRIEREVDGVIATGPSELHGQVDQALSLLNLVVGAVGAVALLVGALSVVNTMLVAVAERTREVGVKRAMGASGWRIARDVLVESATISGLGGLLGVAGGALVVLGVNAATAAGSGTASLIMTSRLAVGAVSFAVLLGLLGGAYPARYAARLDPIDALARE